MTFLGLYLVLHYAVRLRRGYSQTSVFTELKPMILKVRKFVDTLEIGKPPSSVSDAPEYKEVREKFGQSLLTGYAITALLYFITERMRQVVNSRRLDIYFVGSLAYSAVLTTVAFGFEFFGLYRLNSNSFTGLKDPTVVDFIGYSFSTLMTASASPLTPASRWAFLLSQLEVLSALTLLVLLVFLVLTSIRERYKNDLDSMVLDLKQTSDHASQLITTNSDLTMEGIVAWLVEWNPQLAKLALFLMHGRIAGADLYEKVVASQAIRVPEESDIGVAIQAESTAQSTLSRDQLLEVKPRRRKPRKGD